MDEELNKNKKPSAEQVWRSKSKGAKIDLPDSKLNVYEYLYECNKEHLDDLALNYELLDNYDGTVITYRKLFKMIDDCARSFKQLGVKKGDMVTVCLPSFVENIVIFYALNKIGAFPNQIHPLASKKEVEFYLEEAKSKIFVGYDGNFENFSGVVEKMNIEHVIMVSPTDALSSSVKAKIVSDSVKAEYKVSGIKGVTKKLSELTSKKSYPSDRYISYTDFIKAGKKYKGKVEIVRTDDGLIPCSMTHTSGTTGKSKGVLSSAFGFNEMTRQIAIDTPILQRGDKELLVLPPYPVYVLCNQVHMVLSRGIGVIVVPKVDYKNIHKYFEKYEVNAIQAIPIVIDAMVNDPNFENISLENMKFVVSGGGYYPIEKIKGTNQFLAEHNCKYPLTIGYGLSEMGSCATCTFNEEEAAGTIGRPLNDTNIMIVDPETKEELGYDQEGEMWLSGPSMMLGYYNNEEANKKIFEVVRDENGKETTWVKTGDVGKILPSGYIKYVGRQKRITMIVDLESNTVSKVSSDYVEELIVGKYKSGNVSKCVVVSVPSEQRLNQLKAYVVIREPVDYQKVIDEVQDKCEENLREMARPIEYVLVDGDDMPQTQAGKDDFMAVADFENNPQSKVDIKVKARIRKRSNA